MTNEMMARAFARLPVHGLCGKRIRAEIEAAALELISAVCATEIERCAKIAEKHAKAADPALEWCRGWAAGAETIAEHIREQSL